MALNILLVGHEGYLASALVPYFKKLGYSLTTWGSKDNILNITSDVVQKNKIDVVLNFATVMTRVKTEYLPDSLDQQVNVQGTQKIVDAISGTKTRFVQISTKDIYGNVYEASDIIEQETRYTPKFLINETQRFQPLTPYAKSKLAAEQVAKTHPYTNIIRVTSGYTDFLHKRGNWVMNFCKNIPQEHLVTLSGSGKQLRDLLHVNDLGNLIHLMIAQDKWGLVLNAGGGMNNAYSIREVAQMVDPTVQIQYTGEGDYGFVSDNLLAKKELSWEPKILFSERLKTVFNNVQKGTTA